MSAKFTANNVCVCTLNRFLFLYVFGPIGELIMLASCATLRRAPTNALKSVAFAVLHEGNLRV